ncbi:MAG: ATP-grasp domain-containing protein [Deltaproteobacteria bacterium]|nr:ATP-grasp domain-containing protein [Deltaproteobacteria bacterium]
MAESRTLVVGTTPDYIDWLREKRPGQLFFLTDRRVRYRAPGKQPGPGEELLCNLNDPEESRFALLEYLRTSLLRLNGIACFDCEALPLAALVAQSLALSFPTPEAIRNCRDKHLSKTLWQRLGVRCPQSYLLQSPKDLARLSNRADSSWVLKPASGSGSELVYLCRNRPEIEKAFQTVYQELKKRAHLPLYYNPDGEPAAIVAEEYISGREYSVDFFLSEHGLEILRLTAKVRRPGDPFGTIRGYYLIEALARNGLDDKLRTLLTEGARALSLEQTLCMADFIVANNEPMLLEITPRPGGDCLPALLRAAGEFDILEFAIDCAHQKSVHPVPTRKFKKLAALRFHAEKSGIIRQIEDDKVLADPRTLECRLICKNGDRICLPPRDYDSWLLGYLIFAPRPGEDIADQCHDLHQKLTVAIEAIESDEI